MSDMDQMEVDYTRFYNGLCTLKELRVLRERYKNYSIAAEIQKKIKELENGEFNR